MASSRKSKPSKRGVDLLTHVADRLKPVIGRGDRVLVGLSGGIDSIVLLDMLARLSKRTHFVLQALHVNHQLSPSAGSWARSCRAACRARGIPCRVVKVEVTRGDSVERAARDARYAAFRSARTDFIALAHNEDDQAETLLLQLLRGAGVKGLAAMPFLRGRPPVVRPLLDVPRAEIQAYARSRKLVWIDDESNADTQFTRNWLRHEILPRIAARVPACRSTLARAARNLAEASELVDVLAVLDAGDALESGVVPVERLRVLSAARAKNVLRHLIAARGWNPPPSVRLGEALRQALHAKGDATVSVSLGDCVLKRHGRSIHLVPAPPARSTSDPALTWRGERQVELPEGGVLVMRRRRGNGLSAARLRGALVTIERRRGGERLQVAADRPRRTLKNLLQESGLPPWQRERLPLVYCDGVLACAPGIGVAPAFQARPGEASIEPEWRA